MTKLMNWYATRSGAHITIIGRDAVTGVDAQVTGVRHITAEEGKIIARTDDASYELLS